jgi:hypothetical protein
MIIKCEKYLLITKKFPLEFEMWEGEMTDKIEDAYIYSTEKDVENEIKKYDNPTNYQAIKAVITYEI